MTNYKRLRQIQLDCSGYCIDLKNMGLDIAAGDLERFCDGLGDLIRIADIAGMKEENE